MSENETVQVELTKNWGSLFPGERGTYFRDVAERLIANKSARRVLPDGSLEPWPDVPVPEIAAGEPIESDAIAHVNAAVELFVADGLDEKLARLLCEIGLSTPDLVREHLAAGRSDFDRLSKSQIKMVVSTYGE